ncbi:MAG TPA: cytochrome c biogenesis protein CcdA [Phototrophicaceae bacterium]|nr:cytochrome c biogenesis protein CcdA [Phototrophicaceae bacterium]
MPLSFSLALIAGLVSFLSPCVLPLVPAYIGYMGGRVTNTAAAQVSGGAAVLVKPTLSSRFSILLHGFAFVAGFTFVFVTLGLLSTAFISQIGGQNLSSVIGVISRAGGLLIILFGLHFMGVLPSILNRVLTHNHWLNTPLIGLAAIVIVGAALLWILVDWLLALPLFVLFLLWLFLGGAFSQPQSFWTNAILQLQRALYTDTRRQMVAQGHQSYAGSAIMGVVFAAGWTPCIGPTYGAILTMSAVTGDVAKAGSLLLAYSLGLGIPFIVAAFLLEGAEQILRRLRRVLHTIELVSGAFLIVIGVLVASGELQSISQFFANQTSDLSSNIEYCYANLTQGQLPLSGFVNCVQTYKSNAGDTVVNTVPEPAATAQPSAPDSPSATQQASSASLSSIADAPSIMSIASNSAQTRPVGLEIGAAAPGFSSTTDQGANFALADQHGEVVLLNFWATWCVPCKTEMPEFQKAYAAKANQGLLIVGVNDNESADQITGFRSQFGLTFPLVVDAGARIQQMYGIRSYPTTYVLDRNGTIVARNFGALTVDQIDALIAQALA